MHPTSSNSNSAARGRKRERDRQNQRQKRLREKSAFQQLEQRNAVLEQQLSALYSVSSGDAQHLHQTIESLQTENQRLQTQLSRVDSFVSSWLETRRGSSLDSERNDRNQTQSTTTSELIFQSNSGSNSPLHYTAKSRSVETPVRSAVHSLVEVNLSQAQSTLSELTVQTSALQNILKLPTWERLPARDPKLGGCSDVYGDVIRRLRASPEQFKQCDPEPNISDLLFGSSSNELADTIFQSTRENLSRRPEKLAINWMCYMIARWLIDPTEDNYNRIPPMLHPSVTQLFVPHPPGCDYIIWPQLRDNFIKHWNRYEHEEVAGLLFCTWRIRSTPNADFILHEENGCLRIDPDFLKKISTIDGWVLLDKFWIEYPDLTEGLDPAKHMISEQDLV